MKIVSELGSNFRDYKDLKNSIHLAREAGAHAIKFQWFSEKDLYGFGSDKKNFDDAFIPLLFDECTRKSIEFMVTVFNPKDVKLVNKYLKTFKIASSDACYPELLEEINKTGKEVYLSVGAQSEADIDRVLTIETESNGYTTRGYLHNCPLTLLYCVSCYPCYNTNLDTIDQLRWRFNYDVGLSDHSKEIYSIPAIAKRHYNIKVLEKHFNPFELNTPDAPHSLNFDEFRTMCSYLKDYYITTIGPKENEKDMLTKYKRRCIAITPIEKGDILRYGINYGHYRSKKDDMVGVNPLLSLDGQIAKQSFEIGDGVC